MVKLNILLIKKERKTPELILFYKNSQPVTFF